MCFLLCLFVMVVGIVGMGFYRVLDLLCCLLVSFIGGEILVGKWLVVFVIEIVFCMWMRR